MKTFFLVLFCFIVTETALCQNLNIKFLEQITKVSFVDIDKVMINGYGFEKIREENEGQKYTYAKVPNNDYDSAIIVSILNSKKIPINSLELYVAKNFSIQKIKGDLLENDYLYQGENKLGFWQYEKNKVVFLIAKESNESGSHQIFLIYDDE